MLLVHLKGQSNEIFDLQCFSSFEPALATDQWVKIFSLFVKNSQSYSNFKSENLTPRVSYPGESIRNPPKHDSPGYDSPASQSPRGIIQYLGESLFLTLKF